MYVSVRCLGISVNTKLVNFLYFEKFFVCLSFFVVLFLFWFVFLCRSPLK